MYTCRPMYTVHDHSYRYRVHIYKIRLHDRPRSRRHTASVTAEWNKVTVVIGLSRYKVISLLFAMKLVYSSVHKLHTY